ncbi:MAG: hypothetical protein LBT82_02960 [Oscillospiraceae bacterium]|jgi:hypothetical protein|nr:hypothetical protein [Oscillospiraceae bacterium]
MNGAFWGTNINKDFQNTGINKAKKIKKYLKKNNFNFGKKVFSDDEKCFFLPSRTTLNKQIF